MFNTDLTATYLSSVDAELWGWTDNAQVLAWATGRTIAFREEVTAVLETLPTLPPFPAVVLVLASLRDDDLPWVFDREPADRMPEMFCLVRHLLNVWQGFNVENVHSLAACLRQLHELPADCRLPIDAKSELIVALFAHCKPSWTKDAARQVVQTLKRGDSLPEELLNPKGAIRKGLAWLGVECLLDAFRDFDIKGWPNRRRTGVANQPKPADEIVLPDCLRAGQLIDELVDDPDLFGIARAAKNLAAAVHLPRRLMERDELPLGGVSDIVNRGSLDRLLISELAHDDLTLAVRVALGEALYLRREEPPRRPTGCRVVVVDNGFWLWGTSRFLATSVGLALVATASTSAPVKVLSPAGTFFKEVDFLSREGVMDHLASIESHLSLSDSMESLADLLDEYDADEVVIVSDERTLSDVAFRKALSEHLARPIFLSCVHRSGAFRLSLVSGYAESEVRKAMLDPSVLIERPKRPRAEPTSAELPLILSAPLFPLRLSHNVIHQDTCIVSNKGLVALSHDRRLMHWDDRKKGAKQISACVPKGKRLCFDVDLDMKGVLVTWNGGNQLSLCRWAPDGPFTEVVASYPGEPCHFHAAWLQTGVLVAVATNVVHLFDAQFGTHQATIPIPGGIRYWMGRFFRDLNTVWIVHASGAGRFEEVPMSKGWPALSLGMFDRHGVDGPWSISSDGWIVDHATQKRVAHFPPGKSPWKEASPMAGGHIVRLSRGTPHEPSTYLDLRSGKQIGVSSTDLEPVWKYARQHSYLAHVTAVGFHHNRLLVRTTKPRELVFDLTGNPHAQWRHFRASDVLPDIHWLEMEPISAAPGNAYSLRATQWREGCRFISDSRGVLHFQCADGRLPEAAVVLSESSKIGGWLSDGRYFGDNYYFDGESTAPLVELLLLIDKYEEAMT